MYCLQPTQPVSCFNFEIATIFECDFCMTSMRVLAIETLEMSPSANCGYAVG